MKYWMNRKSKNTVIYLPLLIDKQSIKLTDICILYSLLAFHILFPALSPASKS